MINDFKYNSNHGNYLIKINYCFCSYLSNIVTKNKIAMIVPKNVINQNIDAKLYEKLGLIC
jgi:hypothetical protein